MRPALLRIWLVYFCSLSFLFAFGTESWSGQKKKLVDMVVQGEITKDSEMDNVRNGSLRKVHTFKMEKGKSYQIDMATRAFDAYLRLEDAKKNQLAEDDDSGGNLDARIVFTAPRSEEYRIIATTFNAGAVGKYSLTIKEQNLEVKPPPPPEKYKGDPLKLVAGRAKLEAKLAESEQQLRGKYVKAYDLNLEAGKTYRIDMKSKDFDAFLVLHDREGLVVAANDDVSSKSTDARIVFKAGKSGPYTLLATSLDPKTTGAFELTITTVEAKDEKKAVPPPSGEETSSLASPVLQSGRKAPREPRTVPGRL